MIEVKTKSTFVDLTTIKYIAICMLSLPPPSLLSSLSPPSLSLSNPRQRSSSQLTKLFSQQERQAGEEEGERAGDRQREREAGDSAAASLPSPPSRFKRGGTNHSTAAGGEQEGSTVDRAGGTC